MKRKISYLLSYFLLTISIFLVAKVVFMLCNREGNDFAVGDVADVLWHGLSLDLSTALYVLALPFLLTMVSVWVRVPRWVFTAYYTLIAVALSLAFVADTSLYAFWHFKLDASCLQFLDTPTDAMASVSTGYLLVRLLLFVAVAVAIFSVEWIVDSVECRVESVECRVESVECRVESVEFATAPENTTAVANSKLYTLNSKLKNAVANSKLYTLNSTLKNAVANSKLYTLNSKLKKQYYPLSTIHYPLKQTACFLLLTPLLVIGIRGGLSESTTNIGQVYYSQNQFLNHSAVNPVFSFLSSLDKSGSYIVSYDYFSDDECRQITEGFFSTKSVDIDTLLTTNRPNIVIVIMESCGGQFTSLSGRNNITPHLNRMADEGISFDACYANSWRTDRGVVSILSGYPAFPTTSVMKIPEKSRKLPSIAASLAQEGYECSFFYGGDINFTNMRSYVMASGYERLRCKDDYSRDEQRSAQWGVRDDLMFASVLSDIRQERSGRWMKTLLTLSSHEPWDVPTQRLDDPVDNAMNYLDQCLNTFVDSLRQMPEWDDLLIVVLPDHGVRYQGMGETQRLFNHIPMLWLGGAVKTPRHIGRLCNQTDLAATLLGQMGMDHSQFTFSRDLMSREQLVPLAWHTYNNGVTVFDSVSFMAYDLDVNQVVASEGNEDEKLLRRAKALLQLASQDLTEK